MADWNNPLITTQYDVFLAECKARDVDSATMFLGTATNFPVGSVSLSRSPVKFQDWSGSAWVDKIIDVVGGGTGSPNATGARANLGIGSMGIQSAGAVAITGGTISGLNSLQMAGSISMAANNAYDLASNGAKVRRGYFGDALVLPVGVDKYATS